MGTNLVFKCIITNTFLNCNCTTRLQNISRCVFKIGLEIKLDAKAGVFYTCQIRSSVMSTQKRGIIIMASFKFRESAQRRINISKHILSKRGS